MNTKLVNAAADVVARAMENGRRVPAAVAVALESAQMLMSPEIAAELKQLRKRVAGLETERHSTNEALDDAVQELRARRQGEPVFVYRSEHPDSGIVLGTYSNREAAREHCEAVVRREWPEGTRLSFVWATENEDLLSPEELTVLPGQNDEDLTGYVVTPLEVASAYDEDGDE
ncbi:hypothetical protein AB0D11_02105 [Streptomyces monashensis]|uniref:hypothetical protein n=1 Tax=Streptomyces monashensis TaxID=1678012 RepID=UPI0033F294C5